MADGIIHEGDQILELAGGTEVNRERMAIDRIIFTSTAVGTFVIKVGNTQMSFDNISGALTCCLPLSRSVNHIELVSGPVGAVMYVLLEMKR